MRGRAAIFENIYRHRIWGSEVAGAGAGSEPDTAELLAEELPRILEELGATSVLDAGCGDGMWQPDLPGYIGVDIAPSAIRDARHRHPDRDYRIADIVVDVLPRTDVVLCRDTLMHLGLDEACAAIENFRRTGARWLVATSYPAGENREVPPGGYYHSNLEAPPFELGEPQRRIEDSAWVAPHAAASDLWQENPHGYPIRAFAEVFLGVWPMVGG